LWSKWKWRSKVQKERLLLFISSIYLRQRIKLTYVNRYRGHLTKILLVSCVLTQRQSSDVGLYCKLHMFYWWIAALAWNVVQWLAISIPECNPFSAIVVLLVTISIPECNPLSAIVVLLVTIAVYLSACGKFTICRQKHLSVLYVLLPVVKGCCHVKMADTNSFKSGINALTTLIVYVFK